ncbi:uncharacterized protein LOC127849600 [Dreissena polymorpha]|uniref:uncharacterized protein LOC127849600 n=1 Tax=Dreissena polymorpha TaxID=45954 RepID=UPI0022654215|nr:uncharacterized protein LOC127849600 [Dreissena polymorpha]
MQYKVIEFVLFLVCGLCNADIRCFPNGTIVVPNPGGRFNKVDVNSTTCRLRELKVNEEVWLDNCQMDANHTVTFLKLVEPGILTGDLIQSFVCKQIPEEGVILNVSVGIKVTEDPSIPTKEQVLDNGVRIITRLGENTSGAKVPAQDARKIVWDIQIAEFRIIPEVCSYMSKSGPVILLQNGCSKASGQVSNFVTGASGGFLWVFPASFSDRASNDVAIVCSVRVCLPSDSDNCNANCEANRNNNRRRRRNTQKRSTFGLRSEVAILTIQFDTPEVTSLVRNSQCPMVTPTLWMITPLIFLVMVVLQHLQIDCDLHMQELD